MTAKTLRTCPNGHQYYKSSDCPVCPQCEAENKPDKGFMAGLPAPARRALQNAGIVTLKTLAAYTEKEILALHGIGKTSIPHLKKQLENAGLSFVGNSILEKEISKI